MSTGMPAIQKDMPLTLKAKRFIALSLGAWAPCLDALPCLLPDSSKMEEPTISSRNLLLMRVEMSKVVLLALLENRSAESRLSAVVGMREKTVFCCWRPLKSLMRA